MAFSRRYLRFNDRFTSGSTPRRDNGSFTISRWFLDFVLRSFRYGLSFQLRFYNVPNWGLLMFFGILTVLFSPLLMLNPVFTGIGIVFMTGAAFMVMGVFRIILAFNLKRIHKYL